MKLIFISADCIFFRTKYHFFLFLLFIYGMNTPKPILWTRDFVLITVANLLICAGSFLLIPTLPIYATELFKADKAEVGYIVGIYTLSGLLIRPFIGFALDTFGRKLIYWAGVLIFVSILPLYATVSSMFWLLIVRFWHGFLWGVVTTGGSTVASDIVPPARRGEGIGYYGMSFTIAMALGPVVGLLMIQEGDFGLVFYTAAVMGLGALVLALWVRYPAFETQGTVKLKITKQMLYDEHGVPAALIALVCSAIYGGLISFITLYMKELNLKTGLAFLDSGAVFFMVYAFGLTIIRPFAGKQMDRNGPGLLVGIGLSILMFGLFWIAFAQEIVGFLLASWTAGVGMGIILPTILTMMVNLVEPERRGVANSTFFSAVDIGVTAGTIGLGILAQATTIRAMYYACGACIVLPLVIFYIYILPDYQQKIQAMKDRL